MISGKSIVGRSSCGSAAWGGGANMPLSYCVCASPSTSIARGSSTTSSCTSIPSALAALCAAASMSMVPSNASMSCGVPAAAMSGAAGRGGGGGGGGGRGARGARGGRRRHRPHRCRGLRRHGLHRLPGQCRLALGARQRFGRVAVHGIGRQQPAEPLHRLIVALAALGDVREHLEAEYVLGVERQHLAKHEIG